MRSSLSSTHRSSLCTPIEITADLPPFLGHGLLRRVLGCELTARGLGCNGSEGSKRRREPPRVRSCSDSVLSEVVVHETCASGCRYRGPWGEVLSD
jgi:hypothetical protein